VRTHIVRVCEDTKEAYRVELWLTKAMVEDNIGRLFGVYHQSVGWNAVRDFNFGSQGYEHAAAFAADLSMGKWQVTEFDNGKEIAKSGENCAPAAASVNSDQPSPFSSAERPMTTGPDA